MLICAPGKRDEKNNAGNVGTLVRHNISHNDHNRLFNVSGYVTKTLVHDNAFYVGPGLNVDAVFVSMWNGWPDDLVFRNNRFYVEGTARYGHQLSWDEPEGLYELGPGWEPARGVLFEGNRFYGTHTGRPSDPKAVVKQKVKPRVRDWNVPRFNPSNPDGFDEFLAAHRAWMLKLFETEFSKPVKLERRNGNQLLRSGCVAVQRPSAVMILVRALMLAKVWHTDPRNEGTGHCRKARGPTDPRPQKLT